MHLAVRKIRIGDTKAFMGIVRDISDLKEAERNLISGTVGFGCIVNIIRVQFQAPLIVTLPTKEHYMKFEPLELRNLLAADFPTCWVEFETIGNWRRDVTLGVSEVYELKATNTHPDRAVEVFVSASNFHGGVSSISETSFESFENSHVPEDFDGTLDPGEEVTFLMQAKPKLAEGATANSPGQANGEVLALFAGEGWTEGDFLQVSMSGAIQVTTADADRDGEVGFRDFLILSANFGKQVDSYFAGDFDQSGIVDFEDFLILSANYGARPG